MLRLMGFSLLCACAGATGPDHPGSEQHRAAQTDPWLRFVDEYCGRWAETVWGPGREQLYIEFYEGTMQLPPEQVSDFPFRVLADIELKGCWSIATQVVGFAGTPEDGLKLVDHLERYRAERVIRTPKDFTVYDRLGGATHGLTLMAARLGGTHPTSTRIMDFVFSCAEPEYWLEGQAPRVPFLEAWRSLLEDEERTEPLEPEAFRRAMAGHALRRCVHALGNLGNDRATRYLEMGEAGFSWQRSFPVLRDTSYRFALRKNLLIQQMGLDEFIRRGYSWML